MTAPPAAPWRGYTVSTGLLARPDMVQALAARDMRAAFTLMRRWDHVSQDRLAASIDGFNQPRVSRIVGGRTRVEEIEVIERICDGLRIILGVSEHFRQVGHMVEGLCA
jgi:hypothetical protein